MNVEDAELVEAGWKVITGGLRAFMASSRLADLVARRGGPQAARAHPGRGREHSAVAGGDRLQRDARAPGRRLRVHVGLGHRHGGGARRQGLRVVAHHAARALHRRGGRGGGRQRGGRDGRRAGALRRLHGDLRPAAGGRSLQQPDRPLLPGRLVLCLQHAVPGPARPRRRGARAQHLRPRRDAGAGRLARHHLRGPAHRPHRPDQGRRARRAAEPLVRHAAAAPRSGRAREARDGSGRGGGRARAAQRLPRGRRLGPVLRGHAGHVGVQRHHRGRRSGVARGSRRARRQRPLRGPHLVHVPDQRVAGR